MTLVREEIAPDRRNEHPSIVEREESEVDSASSCSPKHIHRPRCERNFTGYIDKRAGSLVGQPGGGAGREEKGDAKKTSGGRAAIPDSVPIFCST